MGKGENLKNVEELIEEFKTRRSRSKTTRKGEKKKKVDEYRRMKLPGSIQLKLLYSGMTGSLRKNT